MAASLRHSRPKFLSNLNLRSESLNIVKEQAVILEKIFYYNDVFSLDDGKIPNMVFFNQDIVTLAANDHSISEDEPMKKLSAFDFLKVIRKEMKSYFDVLGDRSFKIVMFTIAQIIVCLPFWFNYFEP